MRPAIAAARLAISKEQGEIMHQFSLLDAALIDIDLSLRSGRVRDAAEKYNEACDLAHELLGDCEALERIGPLVGVDSDALEER